MPYAIKYYIGLFITGVVVTIITVRFAHLGPVVIIPFAIVSVYLTIVTLRWLGKKNL